MHESLPSDLSVYVNGLPSRQAYLKQFVDSGTCTKQQAIEYACICAESTLPLVEDYYLRQAIKCCRRWLACPEDVENRLEVCNLVGHSSSNNISFICVTLANTVICANTAGGGCDSRNQAAVVGILASEIISDCALARTAKSRAVVNAAIRLCMRREP
jgi:hypothetical protein